MRASVTGFHGELLPAQFARGPLLDRFAGRLGEETRPVALRRFAACWRRCEARIGPATAVRTVVETCAVPILSIFGWRLDRFAMLGTGQALGHAEGPAGRAVPVVVTGWSDDLDRCWRTAVRASLISGAAWSLACNARELRIVDAARPWSRRHVGFDLARCAADTTAFGLLWALARAEAVVGPATRGAVRTASALPVAATGTAKRRPRRHTNGGASLLEEIVAGAAREREAVCASLERGVREAIVLLAGAFADRLPRQAAPEAAVLLDHALTVIYRLLFLLFAEARALVPTWHRTYAESYSVSALCAAVQRDPRTPGLWAAVQAVSRLAHRGCRVGLLRVTAFNGQLFAPERAPLADRVRIGDPVLREVIAAITTAPAGRGVRAPIVFRDLGVEQLGAIYERVLDHRLIVEPPVVARTEQGAPAAAGNATPGSAQRRPPPRSRPRLVGSRADRKASAAFYTPRPLTDLIVRRTLAPLVEGVPATAILRLRIVDPAMGSGAFLVSACRYLARAYETALIAEQQLRDHEIDDRDRAGFRREIARRCLFGVDCNPTAVHLARLSLWLATLAADVPLTFLDHHLRAGNSLVGATLADLLRQSPGGRRRRPVPAPELPLLAADALTEAGDVITIRRRLADDPDDTVEAVRAKERLLTSLEARGAPLSRWRDAADLWCGAWFWPDAETAPRGALYNELLAAVLGRDTSLRSGQLAPILATLAGVRTAERFFHWHFEFPEVFLDCDDGAPTGFDAVIGNPPWEMLRDDGPGSSTMRGAVGRLGSFVRDAGIYAGPAEAHANLYLLFVERALHLLREGGRLGLLVPWGLAGDQGAARVRRALLERCAIDACLAIDNRRGLFPIHRSLRLVVVAGTTGGPTRVVPLQRVTGTPAAIDACPDVTRPSDPVVRISAGLLEGLSPGSLAVPDVGSVEGLRLLDRLFRGAPPLAAAEGWGARFGRELNQTDDRDVIRPVGPGLPVIEGRHVEPFRARVDRAVTFIRPDDAARRLRAGPFHGSRVAYRDVASATNQRTLIAAVVPAGVVTTHTLFCCRTALAGPHQHALCALLNSVVANWIVRRWVSSHVTVSLVERLPVPGPVSLGDTVVALSRLARRLSGVGQDDSGRVRREARLQALVALAWGITHDELALILEDFPLLDESLRSGTLGAYERLARRT